MTQYYSLSDRGDSSTTTSRPATTTMAKLLAALASCLMLAATGCDKAAPASQTAAAPKVSVEHPISRSISNFDDYNGWLEAPQTVEVRARVRGHIHKVHFTDGQLVKKDDLLFELDPRPFQAEIDRALEQVQVYQAQLNFALVDEKRLKEMAKTQVASSIEVETSEAKARSLEAQVEADKKEVERKRLELTYSRITAEISGRIGRAMMTEGNLVNAGGSDPLLATITAVNPIAVYFNVDERALQRYAKARVASTQPRSGELKDLKIKFQFGLETDDGYPREGILDFADNAVNSQTGTIVVRGEVDNSDGVLVPGSRAKIRLSVDKPIDATLVPDTAILADQDRKYVLVVDDKNVVQRRDVNPGRLQDDGMRVILPGAQGAGLKPDDWIVVQGLQMARINYPVDPVKPGAAKPAPGTQPAQANLGQ